MTQITSPKPSFWDALIQPNEAIENPVERRRARVLAGASLALMLCAALLAGWGLIRNSHEASQGLPALALFFGSFVLSRTKRPDLGAYLVVAGTLIGIFVVILLEPTAEAALKDIPFILLPVLLSALLLEVRLTATVAAIVVLGLAGISFVLPFLPLTSYLPQFIAVILISALAVVTGALRERDISTIEKQTTELTRYSETLQSEARNVVATAQIAQAITGTRDLKQLLKQTVDLIIERFRDFYHAQVFLVDDAREFAVLEESTGDAGRALLARGHKLGVGTQSVIGQVAAKGEPIIVSDADTDPTYRRNELLPDTRSEMALPLVAGGRVIGVLDIQSKLSNIFTSSDTRVFQTMADQLAISVENARLFERAQRDLEEIENLNRRLTREGWQTFQRGQSSKAAGYQADASGIRPLPSGEDRQTNGDKTIRMPLMIRGEAVGMLDVTSRSGEPPSPEVQSMIEAVAERVALALDSTRLSESTLRQAERDQVLGRLSAELQATTDLDMILRVAAREASRALGTPRGFVHLVMEYSAPTEGD